VRRDSRTVLTEHGRPPDLTVAYGDGPDHVADVRLPRPTNPDTRTTLVLFLHGGFWRAEWDRAHTGQLATALADQGLLVVTPEYRRVGSRGLTVGWPDLFDDVRSAVRILPSLVAVRVGVEVGRVVLAGHSAGGHLAIWAASRTGAAPVSGASTADGSARYEVVALAPVADLREAYRRGLGDGAVAALLGGGPDEAPQPYAAADPAALVPIGCPITVVHGEQDVQVPLDLSRRFVEAARAAGDDVTPRFLPDIDHFQVIDPLSPAWSDVRAAFIDERPR
jgi:acetyl esterase/lipase